MDSSIPLPPGYRLVRALGTSGDSWLVSVNGAPPATARRYRAERPFDPRPLTAKARHQLQLIDCLSLPDGSVLVLEEWAQHGAFAPVWLREPRAAGEAVTALVPLLEQLADMMNAGWCAPGLRLTDLLLDASGRVRLRSTVAWQRTRADATWPQLHHASAVAVDTLVRQILGEGVETDSAKLLPSADLAAHWNQRAQRLRAVAEPMPIVLDEVAAQALTPPGRLGGVLTEPTEEIQRGYREELLSRLPQLRSVLRERLEWIRPRISRRRAIAAGAALAVAMFALWWMLPATAYPGDAQPQAPVSATAPATTGAPTTAATPLSAPEAALQLLGLRTACLAAGNANDCLSAIDQPGSSILADDLAQVNDGVTNAANADVLRAELVSDMGQAALVALHSENTTASVLLVQTEAGWRLRELFG